MHEGGNYVARLLRVGMGVVVDTRGVALYPSDGVADDSLKELAVGRPILAICFLFWGRNSARTNRKVESRWEYDSLSMKASRSGVFS